MSDTPFFSPWLAQLKAERPHFHLDAAADADIAVVGAGIAGVSTAYQLLKHTKSSVILIDAGRIAHGATGRNAGQLVSYFERPLPDIAKAFGNEMAVAGQMHIESAWGLLEDMMKDCALQTPLNHCAGYAGLTTLKQILEHLEEHDIRTKAGLPDEPMMMRIDDALMDEIPLHLRSYILEVPHSVILKMLSTDDSAFIAMTTSKKGCMNGALLCEELIAWMDKNFGNRLRIAERLPMTKLILRANDAILKTDGPDIAARRVVLCTNGFENFEIVNEAGENVDVGFHMTVRGTIGYMTGYLDEPGQHAMAVSYHRNHDYHEPYHYLTRRPYENSEHGQKTLLCLGGPERHLPDRATYSPLIEPPADIAEELDSVLRNSYRDLPPAATRTFLWQGLMGYTPNYIRRIGFEPKNKVLLYNLGCNGVGMLPSIYGAKRITQLLMGQDLPPSIFDPELGDR
jgi:glycine/D-amino acid oxidase-like deaminating enzyme